MRRLGHPGPLRHPGGPAKEERTRRGHLARRPLANDSTGPVPRRKLATLLRQVPVPEGPGQVEGHSLRRTGAKLLTCSGVEPGLVEWIGRRGSSAVKAYFEDARAEARSSSGLALPVSEALSFLIRKAEAFFSTSPNLGDTFLAARGPLRGPLLVRAVPRRLPFAGAPLGHEVMHYIVEAVWAQFVVRGRTSSSRGSSSATHVIAEGRLRGPGAAGSLSVVGTLGPFGTRRCIRKRATGKGTVRDVVMPLMLVLGA